jgi:hypothetical protein
MTKQEEDEEEQDEERRKKRKKRTRTRKVIPSEPLGELSPKLVQYNGACTLKKNSTQEQSNA